MKPIQHAACLCALSALLALSPAVALCENTPAENQQAEDSQLQTGKQANLRKLPNKKSDKLETLKKGSVLAVSDAGCAALFCKAALQASALNVAINTKLMTDRAHAAALDEKAARMLAEYLPLADEVYQSVASRLRA